MAQNATLAGGVAVGSMANLEIAPFGALLLGMVVGVWSVWGYEHVSPFLVDKVGLQDTCGVINLHGAPDSTPFFFPSPVPSHIPPSPTSDSWDTGTCIVPTKLRIKGLI